MVCTTYVETITNVQNATEFMCWLHTRVDKKLISSENCRYIHEKDDEIKIQIL